jgi:hypothetical protein
VSDLQSGQDDLQSIAEYYSAYAEMQAQEMHQPDCSPIICECDDAETPHKDEDYFACFPECGDAEPPDLEEFTFPPMRTPVRRPTFVKKKVVPRAPIGPDMMTGPLLWDCMERSCKHRCFKGLDKNELATGIGFSAPLTTPLTAPLPAPPPLHPALHP